MRLLLPLSSTVFFCTCLLITVPASIQRILNERPVEGDNLTLSCNASGTPHPTVSWVNVSSGQRTNGSVLVLTNINRNQAGEYRCEASNECGNVSESANIDVQCKLHHIVIIVVHYHG